MKKYKELLEDDYLKHLPPQNETLDDILILEDVKHIRQLSKYSKDTLATRLDIISRKIKQSKAPDKLDLISDKITLATALLLSNE